MNTPYNKLLVQIEKKYNDEKVFESGVKLFIDTTFEPEQHVTVKGIVVGVPDALEGVDNNGIEQDIKVGDEIYFNYQVISNNYNDGITTTYHNLLLIDGQEYWMVDYFQVFFIKRNEDIICVGGNVIIDPVIEVKDDKIGSLFIPEMSKKVEQYGRGKVKHIGKGKTHHPTLDVKVGDTVFFRKDFAQKYTMLGTENIFLRQENLLAKA